MAKKTVLQGTVEEQAAQLYDMAVEAMRDGRYSLAYHYLKEIERALPGFRDVPALLAQAKAAKQEQRTLGWGAIVGGIAMIGLARSLGVDNELVLLALAALGLLIGFFVTLALYPRFKRS
ncbi:MAG: hypothetical protein NZ528_00030 [Caldilineales bacterium]|nr:hypothetical protein [Caldilineales bacterium]MDW8318248.1 hypothetical protein [Anaerolineae bacterium]